LGRTDRDSSEPTVSRSKGDFKGGKKEEDNVLRQSAGFTKRKKRRGVQDYMSKRTRGNCFVAEKGEKELLQKKRGKDII